MKDYNQKEKFKAYCAFAFIGLVLFSFCYFAEHIGGRRIFAGIVILFICYYIWKIFYIERPTKKYIWWCSLCGRELSNKEVDGEGVHINCGCEADYKIKK